VASLLGLTDKALRYRIFGLPLPDQYKKHEADKSQRMLLVSHLCRPFRALVLFLVATQGGARCALTLGYFISRFQRDQSSDS
jgi:hypothetical protein